jgi:bifunctional DNA-binding transcriptional regulator/antitoxin component of YhaV-PrlF toxin-antitoxin module
VSSQVSERGQITIDRAIRQELGVQPGMVAYQRIVDGHLEVTFLPAPHRRSLYGIFHRPGQPPLVTNSDQLEAAVMDAVAEELGPRESRDG